MFLFVLSILVNYRSNLLLTGELFLGGFRLQTTTTYLQIVEVIFFTKKQTIQYVA